MNSLYVYKEELDKNISKQLLVLLNVLQGIYKFIKLSNIVK